MDEIQKVLVKVGRKDLAQKYYEKIADMNFMPGKWISQQTGDLGITYAILIEKLKNGSWSVVKINDYDKRPAKTSTNGWYPSPKLINENEVPIKLKDKVLKKMKNLNIDI